MSPLQVCRGYAKHGVCPFPDTCIYAHPPPPEMQTVLTPSMPNLASAHAWEAAGQYFEPVGTGNQGPVCQSWIQSGSCPYGPSCQFTHPPLAVQFPGKPPLPPVFPTSPQQMMYPSFLPPHSKLPNMPMGEPNNLPSHLSLPISNAPPGPPLIAPMYGNPAYPPIGHYQPHHHQMGRGMYQHRKPQLCKNWNKGCKWGENCRFYHPPPGENPPMPPQYANNIYMEPEIKHPEDGMRASVEMPQQAPPVAQPPQIHTPQPHPPQSQPQPQPQHHQSQHQPQPQPQAQLPPQNSRLQSPIQNEAPRHNGFIEKDNKETASAPSNGHVEQKHDVQAPTQPAPTTERTGKKNRKNRKPEKKRKDDGVETKEPTQSTPPAEKKDADPKKEAELDQKIELIRLHNAQSEARHNEVMADKARAKEQEEVDRRATRGDGSRAPGAHPGPHHRRPANTGPNQRPKDNSNNDHPKKHYPNAERHYPNSEKHYPNNNVDGSSNGHQSHPQQHQQHAQGQTSSSGSNRPYNNYHNSPRAHPHPRPVKAYVPTQPRTASPAVAPAPAPSAATPAQPAQSPVTNGR